MDSEFIISVGSMVVITCMIINMFFIFGDAIVSPAESLKWLLAEGICNLWTVMSMMILMIAYPSHQLNLAGMLGTTFWSVIVGVCLTLTNPHQPYPNNNSSPRGKYLEFLRVSSLALGAVSFTVVLGTFMR